MNKIKGLYNDAAAISTTDIWVTETGCGSNPPFGEQGKADALVQLAGASGFFAFRARCKAVIIHRFYTKPEPDGGPFPTYPMLTDAYVEKQPTQYFLQQNWAGAPS